MKTKWIAAVIVLAAFVSGILAGIAGTHVFLHRGGRPHVPRRASHFMVERLDHRLDLTDEQERRVEAILERRHEQMEKIWASTHPRIEAEIKATNDEISSILTPEQRVKFEEIKMRMGRGRRGGRFRTGD
jgi:Spy/CpxP family protein refolding chaperone